MNAVSFSADVLDDAHYSISLVQTAGLDTADIEIESWPLGSDYSQPPASAKSYSLTQVRATGNKLTCKVAVMFWLTDDVTLTLSKPPVSPNVQIVISGIGGSTQLDPLSQADHDAVEKFISDANFPAG